VFTAVLTQPPPPQTAVRLPPALLQPQPAEAPPRLDAPLPPPAVLPENDTENVKSYKKSFYDVLKVWNLDFVQLINVSQEVVGRLNNKTPCDISYMVKGLIYIYIYIYMSYSTF